MAGLEGYQTVPGDYAIYSEANQFPSYVVVGEAVAIEKEVYVTNSRFYFPDRFDMQSSMCIENASGEIVCIPMDTLIQVTDDGTEKLYQLPNSSTYNIQTIRFE